MPKPRRTSADMDDTERRIRAALCLTGLDFAELAARIGRRSLGQSNLKLMNDQTEDLARKKEMIADACGLDRAFFSVDFTDLAGFSLGSGSGSGSAGPASAGGAGVAERLSALESSIEDLRRLVSAGSVRQEAAVLRASERDGGVSPRRSSASVAPSADLVLRQQQL